MKRLKKRPARTARGTAEKQKKIKNRKNLQKKPEGEAEIKKSDMRRARRRMRAKRRLTVFGFLFLCAAVIVFILKAPIFNIKSVVCVGNENLSETEVIKAAGVKTGGNIFGANVGMMKKQLAAMPEIAESNVRRIFPNKIKIWVREAKPAVFVRDGEAAVIADRNGRIIRTEPADSESAAGIAELTGIERASSVPGENVAAEDDLKAAKVFECIGIMSELDMMDKIQYIDAEDLSDIKIGYENRLKIVFGGYDNSKYKLKFIKTVIDDKLSPYETASLDYTGDKLYVGPLEEESEETSGEEEAKGTEDGTETSEVKEDESGKEESSDENGDKAGGGETAESGKKQNEKAEEVQ